MIIALLYDFWSKITTPTRTLEEDKYMHVYMYVV
jgi:hypothetical protein